MNIPFSFYHLRAKFWPGLLVCLSFFLNPTTGNTQDALKLPVVKIRSQKDAGEEMGSGLLVGRIGRDLFILTAVHVIENSNDLKVEFYHSSPVQAKVLRANSALDIVALKCTIPIDFEPPNSFALAKEAEKALQSVIVIGHPEGNYWDISYNGNVKSTEFELDDRLFTLAPIGITSGNSGGPVLNLQYELLGLVQKVDQVKAVCIDAGTLLKACKAWEVPTNLLTGVTVENTTSPAGEQDFRYQVFVQEANTAFAAGKWEQAKRAFEEANTLKFSEAYSNKIKQCDTEIAKDRLYKELIEKGQSALNLETALAFYRQAQAQRNTESVRQMIHLAEEKLAKMNLPVNNPASGAGLPETYENALAGEFSLVKGGTFTMGEKLAKYDNEFPPHQVYLADFYIGIWEVTLGDYCRFLNDFAEEFPELTGKADLTSISGINYKRQGRKTIYYPEKDNENYAAEVTWDGAYAYTQWLSEKTGELYRLPTEAEWEYAAKGGHKSKGSKRVPDDYAYVKKNKSGEFYFDNPFPDKNELGIHYMMTSSIEWVSDWYDENYYASCLKEGTVINPAGPLCGEKKILRGGGKEKSEDFTPDKLLDLVSWIESSMTFRQSETKNYKGGFRVVRDPYQASQSIFNPIESKVKLIKGGNLFEKHFSGDSPHYTTDIIRDFFCDWTPITNETWNMVMGPGYTQNNSGCEIRPLVNLSDNDIQLFFSVLNRKTGKAYRLATKRELDYCKQATGIQDISVSNYYLALDAEPTNIPAPYPDPFDQKMVWVDGGSFQMGSEIEKPIHEVTVDGFYISPTEVTLENWLQVIGNDSQVASYCLKCPVGGVSWREAQTFIERLNTLTRKNYRLPTEAEWEFAARGGNEGKGHHFLYAGGNELQDLATQTVTPDVVATKKPNELQLFDMTGNVWEWCLDWFHPAYYTKSGVKNPAGYDFGREKVLRGGAGTNTYISSDKNHFRVSYRNKKAMEENDPKVGFRIVLSEFPAPPPQKFEDPFASDMVFISGGSFRMRQQNSDHGKKSTSKDEKADPLVTVPDYYLNKYEVTRKQWFSLMGYYPENQDACDNCPVSNVSMEEVQDFLELLSMATGKKYRLPSESEWEYAAGGGSQTNRTIFAGTNQKSQLYRYANYCGSGCEILNYMGNKEKTEKDGFLYAVSPVGTFLPNQLGLYDMSGNLSEICQENYQVNNQDTPRNIQAWLGNYQAVRGGDFTCRPDQTQITSRNPAVYKSEQIGFRLAISR